MKSRRLRISVIVLVLVLMLGMVGCQKDKNNDNVPNNNVSTGENENPIVETSGENSGEISEEVLEIEKNFTEIKDVLPEEAKPYTAFLYPVKEFLDAGEGADHTKHGVSALLKHLDYSKDYFSQLAYVLKDLNNDGVEELLLFNNTGIEELKNVILGVYSIKNDEYRTILNSQENMIFKLCENNVIKMEMPSEGYTDFSNLDENFELKFIEAVDRNAEEAKKEAILNKYKEAVLELKNLK